MSPDFTQFDNLKYAIANKLISVSAYNTKKIERLALGCFKLFLFSIKLKGLKPVPIIKNSIKEMLEIYNNSFSPDEKLKLNEFDLIKFLKGF